MWKLARQSEIIHVLENSPISQKVGLDILNLLYLYQHSFCLGFIVMGLSLLSFNCGCRHLSSTFLALSSSIDLYKPFAAGVIIVVL